MLSTVSTLVRSGLLIVSLAAAPAAVACPFCAAESRTLTEEMNDASVVLLTRLVEPSAGSEQLASGTGGYGYVDPETGAAEFRIEQVLKGERLMEGVEQIEAIYFGEPDPDRKYFIRGVGEPADWAIPLALSPVAAEYVPKLVGLPPSGAERIVFFLDYLQHEDPLLGQDAYDEFARAPYQDVIDIRESMDRQQLIDWIEDPGVSPSRRRLFLTMLGVCGEPEDTRRLEELLASDSRALAPASEGAVATALATGGAHGLALLPETIRFHERQRKLGLDAMIACYLTLSGKHADASRALDLIDQRFLTDPGADYSHIYAALQALRFLAEEQQELIPLPRVLESARLLLDHPDFADQVVPDLARWEDWSVLERLAGMFERSVTENREKYVREPIITYLDVASEQSDEQVARRATEALALVEPLDPAAVKRARSLRAFGMLAQARSKPALPSPGGSALATGAPSLDPSPLSESPDESAAPRTPSTTGISETPSAAAEADPPPPSVGTEDPAGALVPSVAAGEAPTPPHRLLLIGAPIAGALICVGLFWMILRGGVA